MFSASGGVSPCLGPGERGASLSSCQFPVTSRASRSSLATGNWQLLKDAPARPGSSDPQGIPLMRTGQCGYLRGVLLSLLLPAVGRLASAQEVPPAVGEVRGRADLAYTPDGRTIAIVDGSENV